MPFCFLIEKEIMGTEFLTCEWSLMLHLRAAVFTNPCLALQACILKVARLQFLPSQC